MNNNPSTNRLTTMATMATNTPLTFRTAHLIPVEIGYSPNVNAIPSLADQVADKSHPSETRVTRVNYGAPTYETGAMAFESVILRWLNEHPPQNLCPDICAGCDEPLGDSRVSFLDGVSVHTLEPCWRSHVDRRRAEAVKALAKAGIMPPVGNAL